MPSQQPRHEDAHTQAETRGRGPSSRSLVGPQGLPQDARVVGYKEGLKTVNTGRSGPVPPLALAKASIFPV